MCSDGSCLDNLPEWFADGLQSEQHELLQGIVVLRSGTDAISPILCGAIGVDQTPCEHAIGVDQTRWLNLNEYMKVSTLMEVSLDYNVLSLSSKNDCKICSSCALFRRRMFWQIRQLEAKLETPTVTGGESK